MRFRTRTGPITLIGTLVMVLAVPVFLAVTMSGAAQADPLVDKVTGTYSYYTFQPVPQYLRSVSISAHGTDPVKGSWTWVRDGVTWGSGPVTCLHVDGNDAWVAGPTWDNTGAVLIWVHDGATPGRNGDAAFTVGLDIDWLPEFEDHCENGDEPWDHYGLYTEPFPVVSGNLNVWDTP